LSISFAPKLRPGRGFALILFHFFRCGCNGLSQEFWLSLNKIRKPPEFTAAIPESPIFKDRRQIADKPGGATERANSPERGGRKITGLPPPGQGSGIAEVAG
jgi:hypothetical protein